MVDAQLESKDRWRSLSDKPPFYMIDYSNINSNITSRKLFNIAL